MTAPSPLGDRRLSGHFRPDLSRKRLHPLSAARGARLRGRPPRQAGPLEKPVGHTEIARRSFQEERNLAIDPALSVAFHLSGEAPGAAVHLAATPSVTHLLASRRCPRHRRASTGLSTLAQAGWRLRPEKRRIRQNACHPRIAITPSRPEVPRPAQPLSKGPPGGFLTPAVDRATRRIPVEVMAKSLPGRVPIDPERAPRRPQRHPDWRGQDSHVEHTATRPAGPPAGGAFPGIAR